MTRRLTVSLQQDLEFHGVMRFYFQDRVAGNFATKCIRVSSTATTQDVIETLAEKFRPDMRMLSSPKYSLYEVHVSGGESHKRSGPQGEERYLDPWRLVGEPVVSVCLCVSAC